MVFVGAELEQTELRLANKIMTNLEGKYLEKAHNGKVLIERLEREADFSNQKYQIRIISFQVCSEIWIKARPIFKTSKRRTKMGYAKTMRDLAQTKFMNGDR